MCRRYATVEFVERACAWIPRVERVNDRLYYDSRPRSARCSFQSMCRRIGRRREARADVGKNIVCRRHSSMSWEAGAFNPWSRCRKPIRCLSDEMTALEYGHRVGARDIDPVDHCGLAVRPTVDLNRKVGKIPGVDCAAMITPQRVDTFNTYPRIANVPVTAVIAQKAREVLQKPYLPVAAGSGSVWQSIHAGQNASVPGCAAALQRPCDRHPSRCGQPFGSESSSRSAHTRLRARKTA